MPNHVHFIIFVESHSKGLSKMVGEGKRFLAYAIVKRLRMQNNNGLLGFLSRSVGKKDRKNGKKHEIFEPVFHSSELLSNLGFYRVLDYIHLNPVSGKWKLCKSYLDYPYSSASYYEEGNKSYLPIYDFRKIDWLL